MYVSFFSQKYYYDYYDYYDNDDDDSYDGEVFATIRRDKILDYTNGHKARENATNAIDGTRRGDGSGSAFVRHMRVCSVLLWIKLSKFPGIKYPTGARGSEETCFENSLFMSKGVHLCFQSLTSIMMKMNDTTQLKKSH